MIFISQLFSNPDLFFQQIIIVVFAICCHEYMHARVALWQGDPTAADQGHLTLNPLRQMGPISLVMLAIVGLAWGQVPVNPQRMKHKYSDALVSFAGPATNLGLFIIFSLVIAIIIVVSRKINPSENTTALIDGIIRFFEFGAILNFALFVLNMLPAPPLDGWNILCSFFPKIKRSESQLVIFVVFVIVILGITYIRFIQIIGYDLCRYLVYYLLSFCKFLGIA